MCAKSGSGIRFFTSETISGLACIRSVRRDNSWSLVNAFNAVAASGGSSKFSSLSTCRFFETGLHLTASGDGVAECGGGQELGLTGRIDELGGVKWTVDEGGESVSVRRFLGLVRVGRRSLELAFGREICLAIVEWISLCLTVVTSGLNVSGMDLLPRAKITISSGIEDKLWMIS